MTNRDILRQWVEYNLNVRPRTEENFERCTVMMMELYPEVDFDFEFEVTNVER